MRIKAHLAAIALMLSATMAAADPVCGYITVMDKFLQTGPGMYAARHTYLLPAWLTYPVKIWGTAIHNQAEVRAGDSSFISLSVDHGSRYTKAANYPLNEATLPVGTTFIGKHRAVYGADYSTLFLLPQPVEYAEGDRIVVAAEGYPSGQIVYPFINFYIEGGCGAGSPYAPNVVMALRGTELAGERLVRDLSWSNHQISAYEVTIPNDGAWPAATAPMVFNGTSSYLEFKHSRDDFKWPNAFSVKVKFRTSDASLSGGQYRTLFVSGTRQSGGAFVNAIGETILPAYVAMLNDGRIGVGTPATFPFLVSTSAYNDGAEHELEWTRTANLQATLRIDGVLVAGPLTDTTNYNPDWPRWGRSTAGGYWNGTMRDQQVTRN